MIKLLLLLIFNGFRINAGYPLDFIEDSFPCPNGWAINPAGDNCFKVFTQPLSYKNARTACQKDVNGSLALFRSEPEFDFIVRLLSPGIHSWIGLKHEKTARGGVPAGGQNKFELRKYNGEKFGHEDIFSKNYGKFWNKKMANGSVIWEPDGADLPGGRIEQFVLLYSNLSGSENAGKMSDIDGEASWHYVCQKAAALTPVTSTPIPGPVPVPCSSPFPPPPPMYPVPPPPPPPYPVPGHYPQPGQYPHPGHPGQFPIEQPASNPNPELWAMQNERQWQEEENRNKKFRSYYDSTVQ
ncbi:lectin c-type domain-containing protein [Ditylenchus destructor]|uniref:Lectin c-type domain-containing protein n=1 Tax=Ditylenchus destructor TaxID=166010 RepID=A0AAD4MY09_9BILA|nr:lectin c-type domain-containing protein [Ditylenchus destructor]